MYKKEFKMKNTKNTQIKLNKTIYIASIIVVLFYSISFCDIGSISPTIGGHIHPDQWQNAGYLPDGITHVNIQNNNPVVYHILTANAPTGNPSTDYNSIVSKINYAVQYYPSELTQVTLQSGTYVLNNIIEIPSNVTLKGEHICKKGKDYDNRTILEFDLSDNEYNCIKIYEEENAGIEDLYIVRIDEGELPDSEKGHNILIQNCENCWVSGVESYRPVKHHIDIKNSNHIEVRGCYFHGAQDYGEGGAGYGVLCDNSNSCLIEDNIFDHLRHSMLVQNEANYNVFGYNYSIGAEQSGFTFPLDLWILGVIDLIESNFSGDMVCHGHPSGGPMGGVAGPMGNLFEGNIGQFMWVDLFHWCNGPDNTFHRNAALQHGYHVYPLQKIQIFANNYLKENNRWLHLFGSPRLRLFTSTYFESYSQITYPNIWGTTRHKTIYRNDDLANCDGDYYNTFDNDESYYYDGQPSLLCTGWPFNPKEDDNSAKLRYNTGGWKHTKSRFDNSVVLRYFVLEQDIVVPTNLPDFMDQDDWRNYDGDLVIPDTVCLIVEPGVTLEFAADKCMFVRGSLVAKGTDHGDGEIIFKSVESDRWEGINIGEIAGQLIPLGISEFEYCKFHNARNILNNLHYHGGAISFYADYSAYGGQPNIIIRNCVFEDNIGLMGGAIYISTCNDGTAHFIIEDCEFYENIADFGGAIFSQGVKTTIRNNLFKNNEHNPSTKNTAGCIYIHACYENEPVYIIGNVMYHNTLSSYPVLCIYNSERVNIINNTIIGQVLCMFDREDNQYYNYSMKIYYLHNIFGDDIFNWVNQNECTINYYNNCIKNIYSYNLGGNPISIPGVLQTWFPYIPELVCFVDPSNGDYSLQPTSNCINFGLTQDEFLSIDGFSIEDWNRLPAVDLNENPRIAAEIIDIGAYEYYNPGIFLPQKEIDFGSVPHDRTETKELVIKNIGSIDLTNIEITFADSIAEYYTIDPDDIPDLIPPSPNQTDSVCIPIEFCCHKMFVFCDGLITITSSDPYMPEVQMMVYGRPALDNAWNWISFPALDRDASGNQDAEEVLEPLVPNANKLITMGGEMVYDLDYSQWIHDNLDDIVSTVCYKLEMFNNFAYYPFSMVGDSISLIPADTEIYLEEGYNWIGYWLPKSQNFDEAFGINSTNNHFDKVLSIQAENWYYRPDPDPPEKDFPGQSKIIPSSRIHPLHYGRGYIVEMSEPIYLAWNDPDGGNTKEGGYEETETFTYVEKSTYEVIDVIGLDETALEIGVLNTDDECLGAAKVDSMGSAQILAHTDTQAKEGTELTFCIYQGKSIKESNNYLLYDFKSQEFIKAPLKAGMRKYNIVLFDSNNPQLLDKLILQQNFPNPFNHKMKNTSISFALPQKDKVMLKIYNIKGQLIKTVIDNKKMDAGYYTVQWDGRNEENKKVFNGVYLYKIENSNSSIIKKMIILE